MEKVWLYAAIGGFVPTLFWLFFWMREDVHEREPRKLILKTFIFGAAAAFFAVLFESLVAELHLDTMAQVWAFSFIEEFVKLFAVFIAALGSVWNNEREDPMIYMITGALGFSAIENMYYIIDYLNDFRYLETLVDGGYRFIGASLLHIVTSAIIGFFIARVFFKSAKIRVSMALLGLLVATAMHTLFNWMVTHSYKFYTEVAFYGVWAMIVVVIVVFEILDKNEKYRIIKDGIIYTSTKKIDYEEDDPHVEIHISEEEKIILENEDIEHFSPKYSEYKKDKFRKKFF